MSVSMAGLETRSLTPDELMQLVERAKEKESEAAFILVLDEYDKEGSLFRSVKKSKVIHGKAVRCPYCGSIFMVHVEFPTETVHDTEKIEKIEIVDGVKIRDYYKKRGEMNV